MKTFSWEGRCFEGGEKALLNFYLCTKGSSKDMEELIQDLRKKFTIYLVENIERDYYDKSITVATMVVEENLGDQVRAVLRECGFIEV